MVQTPAQKDLLEVRQLICKRLRGLPVRVWLFGSHARGTARPDSDIDIALDMNSPWPTGFLAELRTLLEESRVVARVDLVDLSSASPELRQQVEQEGIEWIVSP